LDITGVHDVFFILLDSGNYRWFKFGHTAEIPAVIDAYKQFSPTWASLVDQATINDGALEVAGEGWAQFNRVNFGGFTPETLAMEYSTPPAAGPQSIEVRLGSLEGDVLGQGTLEATD